MDPTEIAERLFGAGSATLERARTRFEAEASREFRRLCDKAAGSIAAVVAASGVEEIALVRAGETVTSRMVATALQLRNSTGVAGLLDVPALEGARRALCPIWPFC